MNMPNLAACHHFMRRSRSATASVLSCGSACALVGFGCSVCGWQPVRLPAASVVAPIPSHCKDSRLDIPRLGFISPPLSDFAGVDGRRSSHGTFRVPWVLHRKKQKPRHVLYAVGTSWPCGKAHGTRNVPWLPKRVLTIFPQV